MNEEANNNPFAGFGESNVGTAEVLGAEQNDAESMREEALRLLDIQFNGAIPQEVQQQVDAAGFDTVALQNIIREAEMAQVGQSAVGSAGSAVNDAAADHEAASNTDMDAQSYEMNAHPGESRVDYEARVEQEANKDFLEENEQESMSAMEAVGSVLSGFFAGAGLSGIVSAMSGIFSPQEEQDITAAGTTIASNMSGAEEASLSEPVAPLAIAQTQEQGQGQMIG